MLDSLHLSGRPPGVKGALFWIFTIRFTPVSLFTPVFQILDIDVLCKLDLLEISRPSKLAHIKYLQSLSTLSIR